MAIVTVALSAPSHSADTYVFHASTSGNPTLDQGEGGGNPFASALIEALTIDSLRLSQLPSLLKKLTAEKSKYFQLADVPRVRPQTDFDFSQTGSASGRIALVLVVSDYRRANGAQSLPGAKHDAKRIAGALRKVGFQTDVALDLGLNEMRAKLSEFRKRSTEYDAAVVYTTGHGLEVNGRVFLLPGDYPVQKGSAALASHALPLAKIAANLSARRANVVFYAGCRDNPFDN